MNNIALIEQIRQIASEGSFLKRKKTLITIVSKCDQVIKRNEEEIENMSRMFDEDGLTEDQLLDLESNYT